MQAYLGGGGGGGGWGFWGRKLLHYVRNAVPVIFALITEEDKGVVQSGVATSFLGFSPTCPGNEVEWSGC